MSLRYFILDALTPIIKWVGQMHLPYTRKKVTGLHYHSILPHIKPGAVLLSRKNGEVSNLFIPGEFTHAAMCSSQNEFVIEAGGDGVKTTDLISFLTSKDRVILLYPEFAETAGMLMAAMTAECLLGMPYDYLFDNSPDAFYCSEIIAYAYGYEVFKRREFEGQIVVLPNDFYASSKSLEPKFKVVWDSET